VSRGLGDVYKRQAPIEGPCVEMIHNGNRALHCF
jgi:hypothetical protein